MNFTDVKLAMDICTLGKQFHFEQVFAELGSTDRPCLVDHHPVDVTFSFSLHVWETFTGRPKQVKKKKRPKKICTDGQKSAYEHATRS